MFTVVLIACLCSGCLSLTVEGTTARVSSTDPSHLVSNDWIRSVADELVVAVAVPEEVSLQEDDVVLRVSWDSSGAEDPSESAETLRVIFVDSIPDTPWPEWGDQLYLARLDDESAKVFAEVQRQAGWLQTRRGHVRGSLRVDVVGGCLRKGAGGPLAPTSWLRTAKGRAFVRLEAHAAGAVRPSTEPGATSGPSIGICPTH